MKKISSTVLLSLILVGTFFRGIMGGRRTIYFLGVFILLCACNAKDEVGTSNSPINTGTKTKESPSTDRSTPDSHTTPDKDEKDAPDHAPCCHGSAELTFNTVEVLGKLSGLSSDLHPFKDYQGSLSITDGVANLDGTTLRVRAGMDGMTHGEIEFLTKQTKQDEFQIDGIVFTMPGTWNVNFQILDGNGVALDACQCKMDVKEPS